MPKNSKLSALNTLNARGFGSIVGGTPAPSSAVGRPRLTEPRVSMTIYLPADLIAAYEREAQARWPGSSRKRGEVMREALECWLKMDWSALREALGVATSEYEGVGGYNRMLRRWDAVELLIPGGSE